MGTGLDLVARSLAYVKRGRMRSSRVLCSISQQEIQDVHAALLGLLVQLGVAALGAADGDELLVLDVEKLGKIAAGGLELVGFIPLSPAFDAGEWLALHHYPPSASAAIAAFCR